MIPIKLQLKNFLSYGSDLQTISFDPYHLICLSGKNGHGKSALLDAITWALWGHARKTMSTAKADQGLLRLGETQMMVILDFMLENQMYRVKREFMKTYGKPHASLEFGTINPQTQEFIPLTDKTIRTTQERIEKTLHLNFDSFVNSAFLRQGNANEFSKKSAKERKEVLTAILGLNQYDTLRKLAMEKAKQAQQELLTVKTLQEKLMLELKQKEHLNQLQSDVETKLNLVQKREKSIEEEYQKLNQEQKQLIEKRKEYDLLRMHAHTFQDELSNKTNAFLTLAITWRKTHSDLLKLPDYKELTLKRQQYAQLIQDHQEKLKKILSIREQLLKTQEQKQTVEHAEHQARSTIINQLLIKQERLKAEQEATHKTVEQLANHRTQLTQEKQILEQEIQIIRKRTKQKDLQEHYATLENQFEKRKEYYQKYRALGNMLTNEHAQSNQKMALVQDEHNPSCPLCEQNVSATRRKFLKQKFLKTTNSIHHRIKRISILVTRLKNLLVEQHAKLQTLKKELDDTKQAMMMLDTFTKSLDDFSKRIDQTDKQQKTLMVQNGHVAQELIELDRLLKTEQEQKQQSPELKQIIQEISTLEQAMAQVQYNQQEHQKIEDQFKKIEADLITYARIQEEKATQTERQKQARVLHLQIKQLKKECHTLQAKISATQSLVALEEEYENKVINMQNQQKELYRQKNELLEQKGNLDAQYSKLRQYEKELKEHEERSIALNHIIEDYQTIASASGKDGIQALLIEEAIPEIEQEANILLAQLTNNQAQLFIESLKDLKKGGTKETLDINISDAQGIRPYELFSGGEAFRIDFALRIAISKLLARRASTSLQTLIIDEGFGSQDEEGLSFIMDALYKIQENFEKVIIVSHLPAMKDQFPVHFVVEKKPSGSVITVVEQD